MFSLFLIDHDITKTGEKFQALLSQQKKPAVKRVSYEQMMNNGNKELLPDGDDRHAHYRQGDAY